MNQPVAVLEPGGCNPNNVYGERVGGESEGGTEEHDAVNCDTGGGEGESNTSEEPPA